MSASGQPGTTLDRTDYTRTLAEFCAGVGLQDLPDDVVEKAKLCILDFLANVYGSLRLEAVEKVVGYVRSLGSRGTASALGCGFRTGLHPAAFLNGTTAEAVEAQDGIRFGGNHPGTAVIPTVLALAEDRGLGGREVLEAVVVGYEIAGRVAATVHPHHTLSGFLPTGTCGAFGAAAAASRLMGHDVAGILNALGNAGYLLPLSMAEQLMGGYTAKIVQGGQAASAGLTAAGLAGAGVTGMPYVLEGSELNGGFTQITTGNRRDLTRLLADLGERFCVGDVYFKPYTACRHTHGAAQAALALTGEHRIEPAGVIAVRVFTYPIAALAVGHCVGAHDSFVAAQFSLPYVVAACLVDGEMGPRQLAAERIADPEILELARKVDIHVDPDLAAAYPDKTSTRVEIELHNGESVVKQIDVPKGDPRDPMTLADLRGKLERFAAGRDGVETERIVSLSLVLETLSDIRDLTSIV